MVSCVAFRNLGANAALAVGAARDLSRGIVPLIREGTFGADP